MRQAPDEADGVGDEIAPAFVVVAASRWVERLEEAVLDGHRRARERVQQGRLADVRVAGESDRRHLRLAALLAARRALLLDLLEPVLQHRDPAPRETAVGLELGLARASGA